MSKWVLVAALCDVLPDLLGRGVLTGRVADRLERWHFVLDDGDTVAIEVLDSDQPDEVLKRFERVLVDRLLGPIERGA